MTWVNLLLLACFCAVHVSHTATPPSGVFITIDITNNTLWSIDLVDQSHADIVVRDLNVDTTAAVYDPVEDLIYFADNSNDVIRKVYRNGTLEPEDVARLDTFLDRVAGLALDPISRLLFYTDTGDNEIVALNLRDPTFRIPIVEDVVAEPSAITVDPENRKIYWSDTGRRTIESADMDGSNVKIVVNIGLASPIALTYDQIDKKLYWCDSELQVIESYEVTTGQREVVLNVTGECTGLGTDSKNIYYTKFNTSHILYVNKQNHADRGIFDQFNGFGLLHGVAVYTNDNAYSGVSPCDSNNSGCAELCLPLGDNGFRCACTNGKALLEDKANCSLGRFLHGTSLIYSYETFTGQSVLNGIEGEPSAWYNEPFIPAPWAVGANGFSVLGMDFHYGKKELFASDVLGRGIVSFAMDGSVTWYQVFSGTSSQVYGIAVDWVHENIYWTDSSFNWVMMASIEQNTNKTRVIVDTELEVPWGIAVHPHMGYIFWTDQGDQAKIERASLDGSNRQAIISEGLTDPKGITVDFLNNKLYWTNGNLVESSDLNGNNREQILTVNSTVLAFTDITYHDGYIFAADQTTAPQRYFSRIFFKKLTDPNTFGFNTNQYTHGIVMYSDKRQPNYENVCSNGNQCEHLCVRGSAGTAACVCADGYKLHADGHSCVEVTEVLGPLYITSYGDQINIVEARHNSVSQGTVRSTGRNWTNIDVDYDGRSIFMSHQGAGATIDHVHLEALSVVDSVVRGVDNVTDVAVDWISSNLYWTEGSYGQIWVSRLDGTYQKILRDGLVQPGSICVHPLRKQMYWSVSGSPGLLMANLDGTNTTALLFRDTPRSSLTLDILDSRLYYVDNADGTVHYILLDDLQFDFSFGGPYNAISVAVYQDFVTFLSPANDTADTLTKIALVRTDIEGLVFLAPVFPVNESNAYDIVAYSKDNQPLADGSCDIRNGGCNQLCLVNAVSHSCACVDGMTLSSDGKDCQPTQTMDGDFFLIADNYRHAIYQADSTLNTTSAFKIPREERPVSADFDTLNKMVYWTDENTGLVKRMNASGSVAEVVNDNSGSIIERIAVDATSGLLYYTDSVLNRIGVMSLTDVSVQKILIVSSDAQRLMNPSSIVLDPAGGIMYYAVRGASGTKQGKIEKANMDGTGRMTIVSALDSPTGIAVDLQAKQLYWCDAASKTVEVIGFNKQGRRLIKQLPSTSNPFAITLQGSENLLLTDLANRGIWSMKKQDGSSFTSIKPDFFTGLNEIKYIPSLGLQSTSCTAHNGGCSHLCIPTPNPPNKMVCACPAGISLSDDGRNCDGAMTCPHQIPNGLLQEDCTRKPDAECRFICDSGLGYTSTITKLKCLPNGLWDQDLNTLCQRTMCEKLSLPINSRIVSCADAVGSECIFQCIDGYEQVAGTARRKCLQDFTWEGSDLVCNVMRTLPPTTTMTKQTTMTTTEFPTTMPTTTVPETTTTTEKMTSATSTPKASLGPPAMTTTESNGVGGVTGKNSGEKGTAAPTVGGGDIAGIVIGLILIIVLVIGGIFVWKRFWPNMKAGRYVSRNENDHVRFENESEYGGADSLPRNIPAVSYNSPSDELHFENPTYATVNPPPGNGMEKPLDKFESLDEVAAAYTEKRLAPIEESPHDSTTTLKQESTVDINLTL